MLNELNFSANFSTVKRVFVIVLDAWGCGAMPDYADYNDSPNANTMGNIDRVVDTLHLPNLQRLGLGNLLPLRHVPALPQPEGAYGKLAERSKGKDTTTGHWEMMGLTLDTPFPTYPDGFPASVIERFIAETGCVGILGNKPASGTAILEELGEAHLQTGYPIVYTSADSVFQIAAHVDKIPLETLYHWCHVAREILRGEHEVSRVIARPFEHHPQPSPTLKFQRRGADRHDYAVLPFRATVMDAMKAQGAVVVSVGKIKDIFCEQGVTHHIPTGSNAIGQRVLDELIQGTFNLAACQEPDAVITQPHKQLVFVNLVDTDMLYGHRRDPHGYARALEAFDVSLGGYLAQLKANDLLLISADHGCDPTAPGSDHTREYVPVLMYQKNEPGRNLGTRSGFADIGQTVLDWLSLPAPQHIPGKSLLAC